MRRRRLDKERLLKSAHPRPGQSFLESFSKSVQFLKRIGLAASSVGSAAGISLSINESRGLLLCTARILAGAVRADDVLLPTTARLCHKRAELLEVFVFQATSLTFTDST